MGLKQRILFIQIYRNSVMYPRDQYMSVTANMVRDRLKRPQTPTGNMNQNSYSQFNQSYTKNPQSYSPHHYQPSYNYPRNQNITKSRISVASSNSQIELLNGDQGEVFPEDLIFLLKNQEKNINNFKQKIEKEKSRVENDFAVFKTQIDHILEDLKLSVQAELDLVYKVFISKYAEIKGEVQEIRRLRKQILMANQVGTTQPKAPKDGGSNFDIMSQIEKDAQHFRNYRVYGYLTQMQKQKLNPILQICNELILIGSVDSPFYRSKQMSIKHKDIKATFSECLADVYHRLKDYVITPQAIVEKEKVEQQNTNNILRNLEQENNNQHFKAQKRQAFDVMYPENKANLGPSPWNDKKIITEQPAKKVPILAVGRSEKSIVTKFAENVSLKKLQRVVTDHSDAILCLFLIDNRYIATGSKDKTIRIYTFDGKKHTTLIGHEASICSLSSVQNRGQQIFLASGSDHGCCCLILWDTRTWNISARIQSHGAAVTSIVDLEDGENLVTGSYDKKIILYDHSRRQVVSSHSNKSAVTSIVLTSDKQAIVSSGLDFTLLVWHIVRKSNSISLQLGKTIPNNAMVCVLQASLLRPQCIIGVTRDGKAKIFNISSQNQIEKSYSVSQNSIIELLIIQRQMKPESPMILSCSAKDKGLCLTKMDTGAIEMIKVNGACNIQFGHGIGPKIVASNTVNLPTKDNFHCMSLNSDDICFHIYQLVQITKIQQILTFVLMDPKAKQAKPIATQNDITQTLQNFVQNFENDGFIVFTKSPSINFIGSILVNYKGLGVIKFRKSQMLQHQFVEQDFKNVCLANLANKEELFKVLQEKYHNSSICVIQGGIHKSSGQISSFCKNSIAIYIY